MILLGKTVSMQKKAEFQFMHGQGKSVQIPPPVFAEAMSDISESLSQYQLNYACYAVGDGPKEAFQS